MIKFRDLLHKYLQDDEERVAYLEAAIDSYDEDHNREFLLAALNNRIDAVTKEKR